MSYAELEKYLEDTTTYFARRYYGHDQQASFRGVVEEQAPAAEPRATELAFWDAIKDSGDPAMFREYLKQFPGGTFAGLARLKIEKLGKRQAAFTAPPKPVTPPPAKPAVVVDPIIRRRNSSGSASFMAKAKFKKGDPTLLWS